MKEHINTITWAHDQLMEAVHLLEMTRLEKDIIQRRCDSVYRAIKHAEDACKEAGEKG